MEINIFDKVQFKYQDDWLKGIVKEVTDSELLLDLFELEINEDWIEVGGPTYTRYLSSEIEELSIIHNE